MAKAFNATEWFRKNGQGIRTAVKTAGLSYKLDGMPAAFTAEGIAKLAEAQGKEPEIKVSTPRAETAASEAKASGFFSGEQVAQLVRTAEKAARELGAEEPEAAPAARNGSAAQAPAGK